MVSMVNWYREVIVRSWLFYKMSSSTHFADTMDRLFRMLQNHALRRETRRREVSYKNAYLLLERMGRKSHLNLGERYMFYILSLVSLLSVHWHHRILFQKQEWGLPSTWYSMNLFTHFIGHNLLLRMAPV